MMALDKSTEYVFINYRAAFDSFSHKFVDMTLKRSGASKKARSMYRIIYKVAATYTGADGKKVRCDTFDIDRGVGIPTPGGVTSPLLFSYTGSQTDYEVVS